MNEHPFRYYGNIRPTNSQGSFDISAKVEHDFGSTILTAWALYSDVDRSLTADGTSADFARFIGAADPAANNVVNSCFASTAANTGFPVNQVLLARSPSRSSSHQPMAPPLAHTAQQHAMAHSCRSANKLTSARKSASPPTIAGH